MQNKSNISEVTRKSLCHGCGLCASVCPVNCISISVKKSYPVVDESMCTSCGMCLKACSGHEFNYDKELASIEKLKSPKYYLSKSASEKVLKASSSGGTITSILSFMLGKGIINGAIVVGNSNKEPWVPEARIARTKAEIENAVQSKYCLVPTLSKLKELRNLKGKYALVGLPCQNHSFAKLLDKKMKGRIFIKIGVFCGLNTTFSSIEYTLKKLGIKDFSKIKKVEHRGGNWPGGFKVTMKNGKEYFIEKFKHNFIFPIFYPNRCRLCPDIRNEFADISVGDAWEKELIEKGDKNSLVIVRTPIGDKIFSAAQKAGCLKTSKLFEEKALSFHHHMDKFKVQGAFDRIKIYRMFGLPIPDFHKKKKSSFGSLFNNFFLTILFWKLSWRISRWVLFRIHYNILGGITKFYRKIMVGKK